MAYWWVSQGQVFDEQRRGHYLWAPKDNGAGQSFFHWRNIQDVKPGDVVFSYVDQSFRAIGIAKTDPYAKQQPGKTSLSDWGDQGWQVDVAYRDVAPSASLDGVRKLLTPLLPKKYAPLNGGGADYEGYLFALPGSAGRLLLDYVASPVGQTGDEAISSIVLAAAGDMSERQALAASRIGQGVFRKSLFEIWNGACVVTGCGIKPLLRATHIKPWRDSNNEERLDPFNGLLLSVLYATAFNTGLISFDDMGSLMLASSISEFQWEQLGIRRTFWVAGLKDEHEPYLAYHRENVFIG